MDSETRDRLFKIWWQREKSKWSFKAQEHEFLAKSAWDACWNTCFRITNQSSQQNEPWRCQKCGEIISELPCSNCGNIEAPCG